MTYRTMHPSIILALAAVAACGRAGTGARATSTTGASSQPRNGAADAKREGARLAANHLGRIPILEYHVIRGTKNSLYTRTPESFRKDLEDVYARGYRPITVSQMLDKDFRDVPPGMSPVIFVFDDASAEQFSYVDNNGQLTIDSTSGVGIWLDFAKTHPGWKNRATFCMLNGGADGHNFFGDGPKYRGQHRLWRLQKVKWLADNGFELCGHTLWHAMLNKYSDAVVQEQIAQSDGDRLRGGGISRADVRAPLWHLAEEPGARLARLVDGSQDGKSSRVPLRCGARGVGRSSTQSLRSAVQSP